jgi:type I restriction enzyme S subunit
MIANLQPYPEYKDSGVPWLGEIPAQWDVRRMKLLLREVDSRSSTGKEQLLRVSQYTGVTQRQSIEGSDAPDTRASSLVGYKRVSHDDLVINIMLAWNGSMGVSRYEGIASPAYCVYRFKSGARPWYYHELLRLPLYKGRIKAASTGVVESRLRLYSDDLGRIEALQPPPEEQDAIVRFLDCANGRLERAIRAKRKVIALLHEQKQAIIHRAVTRGLDPTVPLKPSGIPWLGDIPKHWEIVPLKFLCHRIQNGATPPSSEQQYYESGTVPWFGPSSVGTASELGAPVRHLTKAALTDGKARLISGPAILVIVIGATAGRMGLLVGEGATNQQITAFELKEGTIVPQFGIQQLRSSENWLKSTASTATIPILDSGVVNRLPVAFPSCDEQQAILSVIALQIQPLETAVARLEREIALLREYRTRLVADVVTGKLDVRPAARQLPAEIEPPETVAEPEEDEPETVEQAAE